MPWIYHPRIWESGVICVWLVTASYMLIGAMVAGIVGGVLAFKGRGKIAALLMPAGAIVPAIWVPKSLIFTCLLLLGGIVSFFAKPRQTAVSA